MGYLLCWLLVCSWWITACLPITGRSEGTEIGNRIALGARRLPVPVAVDDDLGAIQQIRTGRDQSRVAADEVALRVLNEPELDTARRRAVGGVGFDRVRAEEQVM